MRPARQVVRWYGESFPPPFSKNDLRGNDSIRNELFSSIELYSEVKALGREILKRNGHQDLRASFLRLQAYIRQARTFYEAAEALHYRASPLLYYYSFMNFAKAYLHLRDTKFKDTNLHHGIRLGNASGSIRGHRVVAMTKGVFPLFYERVSTISIGPPRQLSIAALLGYVSDVAFEYVSLQFGA